jgi:hypothetical protein
MELDQCSGGREGGGKRQNDFENVQVQSSDESIKFPPPALMNKARWNKAVCTKKVKSSKEKVDAIRKKIHFSTGHGK